MILMPAVILQGGWRLSPFLIQRSIFDNMPHAQQSASANITSLRTYIISESCLEYMMIIRCNNSHHRTKQRVPDTWILHWHMAARMRLRECQCGAGRARCNCSFARLGKDPTLILVALLQRPVSWWCHMWRQCVGRARRWTRSRNSCCSPIPCWRVSLKSCLQPECLLMGSLSFSRIWLNYAVAKHCPQSKS